MQQRTSHFIPLVVALAVWAAPATAQVFNYANNGNTATANTLLGTNSNHALGFETNGIERMRVDNGGFFGINTTTMTSRANIRHGWGNWLTLQGTNGSEWTFHNPTNQDAMVLYAKPGGGASTDIFTVKNNGNFYFGTGAFTGGAPGGRVNLKQGWSDWMQFHRTLDAGYWHVHNGQFQDRMSFYYTDAGNVSFPGIDFLPSGKISLGITNPAKWVSGYRLYVKDGILAEKVKVALESTADWSDHVFAPDYRLLPLSEVESFIQENCHLPGVPSAEEMVATGLDMAKTDAMLMAKVEELTLYVIELKKELEAFKANQHMTK